MKIILIIAALACLNSCTLRVGADGTRTWSLNAEQAMKAIIIYSEK